MSEPRSQADLVAEHLLKQGKGAEEVEFVSVVALQGMFIEVPRLVPVETDKVKVPALKTLHQRERIDIAKMILSLLDYKRNCGTTGFSWRFGDDYLEVSYSENFKQYKPKNKEEAAGVLERIVLMLKARKNIKGLKWDFGKDYVEMTLVRN